MRASERSLNAKERYQIFNNYINDNQLGDFLPLIQILAEVHFWLDDIQGCYNYLLLLLESLKEDEQLKYIISLLNEYLNSSLNDDDSFHNFGDEDNSIVYKFETPFIYPNIKLNVENLSDILLTWKKLEDDLSEDVAIQQFKRYACLATNELEQVFNINGQSYSKIIKRGFFINSIDGISYNSKVKNKQGIIRILNNTSLCLDIISEILNDYLKFNEDFIKRLHRTILNEDNMEFYISEDLDGREYTGCRLILTGEFRKISCISYHNEGKEIIQFCHHLNIDKEMKDYCRITRELLYNDNIDPFIKAAWIQWTFLRIHPFEDGNGRISRIISSIPLLKLNIPPIIITNEGKEIYFDVLRKVDTLHDITIFSEYLIDRFYQSIDEIRKLN